MSENGELDEKAENRIKAGWRNWRRMSGILCDKGLAAKRKGKVFKVAVRPSMTCGAETWAIKSPRSRRWMWPR